jgi:hypothetical protein
MTAHVKFVLNVSTLLERHTLAWAVFDAAWKAAPEHGASQHTVDKLTATHDDLWQATPVSMAEWFGKWDTIRRFEAALGDSCDVVDILTRMLSELEQINMRWMDDVS